MNDLIGKTIGRYRIIEHLGRGGMAEVYKAHQPSLDRYVAIKLMHTFLADEKEFLARFEREAKVVATLRHPNIVQVYDFDVENGVYYMVMEFINGETLKARLQALEARGEWVSRDDAVRITLAVGSALKYAHERNMVHRDVKPANVMITTDGQVILTDFGIAKIVSASNLTASGAMVGTPSYMAPEQGMGQPGDERSDIYSLGVMLYQLVVGRLPFDADTPLAVVLKHINEPLPLPQVLKPDLPDALNAVILKALAKDPNERYQKVAEMLTDLRRAVGLPVDESEAHTAKDSSIKLSGATIVGRVSGLTPPPPTATTGTVAAAAATQIASPQTVVSSGAVGTVVVSPTPTPVGVKPAKRPAWIIPVIIIAGLAVVVVVFVVMNGNQAASVPPTATATATAVPTIGPTDTSTPPAVTTVLFTFNADQVQLHDAPDAATRSVLLPKVTQFHLRARTGDGQWLNIETPDGVTGWVQAAQIDFGATASDQLNQLPLRTTVIQPTDTPTITPLPTETLSPTATATETSTPQPTQAATATKVPVTPKPTKLPATAVPTAPAATATQSAAIPLGYGFEFKSCTYDGPNYTCNVRVWGNGGDGRYHYAMPDENGTLITKDGSEAFYVLRYRRCKTANIELRVFDDSGGNLVAYVTMDPNAPPVSDLLPGPCTPP
ncbi:MAG: protein kinase [Anaerolineae bacterium]